MTNKPQTNNAENSAVTINENETANTINELKAQIELLTKMVTANSQQNKEAEEQFFKNKPVFTITTFREPDKSPEIHEVKVK